MSIHTSYLQRVYNVSQFAKVVEQAIPLAKRALRETKFDTIAFTGTSGAALAYILSNEMGIPLICVRKKDDGSHFQNNSSNGRVEGNLAAKRYLIVDDFICGGNTLRDIMETVKKSITKAECVSILLYDYSRGHRDEFQGVPVYASREDVNFDQRTLQFAGWYG